MTIPNLYRFLYQQQEKHYYIYSTPLNKVPSKLQKPHKSLRDSNTSTYRTLRYNIIIH